MPREDVCALLVCRLDNGRIVGVINLSQIFRRNFQNAIVGFWAAAEFAGRGYMLEGLRLAIKLAFIDLRLHRLEANIQPKNLSSKKLVQRIGFHLEGFSPRYLKVNGRWRDDERWAICREEWRTRKAAETPSVAA